MDDRAMSFQHNLASLSGRESETSLASRSSSVHPIVEADTVSGLGQTDASLTSPDSAGAGPPPIRTQADKSQRDTPERGRAQRSSSVAVDIACDERTQQGPGAAQQLTRGGSSLSATSRDHDTACRSQAKAVELYRSARFKQLLHPLDKAMIPSYLLSLFYLVVALISVGPTLVIVLVMFPVCFLLVRALKLCCARRGSESSSALDGHEEFWLDQRAVSQCLITLTPGLDLSEVRQLLLARLVMAENSDGKKLFPRFTQKLLTLRLHHRWMTDPNFDICNHVISAPLDDPAARIDTDEDLQRFVARMEARKLSRERPLWEVLVVVNVGAAADTALLVRTDACVADGVAVLSLVCRHLAQNSVGYGSKKLFGRSAFIFNVFRSLFVGFLVLFTRLFSFKDQNLLHGRRLLGRRTTVWSDPMSLAKVFRIKDVTRTSLNDVLLSVLSGSIREYLISHGMRNPYNMRAALLVSLRKHRTYRVVRKSDYYSDRIESRAESSNAFRELHLEAQTSTGRSDFGLDSSESRLNLPALSVNTHPTATLCVPVASSIMLDGRDGTATQKNGQSLQELSDARLEGSGRGQDAIGGRPMNRPGLQPMRSNMPLRSTEHCAEVPTGIELSLVNVTLPTNTEGAIPQLWDIKLNLNETKSATDHVVFYNSHPLLRYILPEFLRRKIWRLFFNRCSILISNLPGPEDVITLASSPPLRDRHSVSSSSPSSPQVKSIMHWPPSLDGVGVSVSFMTYAGQLQISINADDAVLPDPKFLTSIFVERMNSLSQLLSNRRLPGERTSRRLDRRLHAEPDINQIQSRMVEVQRKLHDLESSFDVQQQQQAQQQQQQRVADDETILVSQMESLKVEFHEMLQELRRRMSEHHPETAAADDFDDEDGELRHPHRLRSLSGVSHRSILSALSAGASRVLQTGSPSPSCSSASSSANLHAAAGAGGEPGTSQQARTQQRKYHSFHQTTRSPSSRPGSGPGARSRMSFDATNAAL